MKTTLLFGLLLSISWLPQLQANSTLVANYQFCLHAQLTTHNWETEPGTVWQFYPDGTLLQLEANTQRLVVGQWSLQAAKGMAVLQLELKDGQRYWSWERDCSAARMQLVSSSEQRLEIHALPSKEVSRTWLIGDWQEGLHANHPVLSFAADGTYQRLCTATGDLELTTGHWMLSNDGSTILLHPEKGQPEALALKYLNMDELVVRPYRAGATDCFLNKL